MVTKKRKINSSGYSLLELIIALGIITIISAVVVANFRQAEKSNNLRQSSLELESNIRLVRSQALAGQLIDGVLPLGGYGLFFSLDQPTSYIIFADLDGDHYYDNNEQQKIMKLSTGVIISNISPQRESHLVFDPPKPKIYINQQSQDIKNLAITLQHQQSKEIAVLTFNMISGQIEIN